MAFTSQDPTINHNDQKKPLLICEWCDCTYTVKEDKSSFLRHVYQHIEDLVEISNGHFNENPREFQCLWRDCTLDVFMNGRELAKHVMFHAYHAYLKALGAAMRSTKQLPPCTLSDESRNLIDADEELVCCWEDCRMQFHSPDQFYRHMDAHGDNDSADGDSFVCRWLGCSAKFKSRYRIKEHCRVHTGQKVIACNTCGGLFASNTKFIDHLNRQSEDANLRCLCCNKQFATKRLLRNHERGHVNNSKCTMCDMTFPSPSGLKRHILYRHTEQRPYQCALCHIKFKSEHDLNRHIKIHDDQVLLCPKEGCDYTSKFLQSIKAHYAKEHEAEMASARYACHICGCRYTRGYSLTSHLKKKHHFEWPGSLSRLIYSQCDDGMYRLQTVRYESVELQVDQNKENHQSVIKNLP
ncbi:uncharacterized protein TRIADDRAFT_23582 [Trichoplax adhaerens]|uniref:C2H2-type domain-containing protein n=1 Tax=Trichoplax adhaerens TaxID=10228 RepID=B3RTT5_TRIAD|nr:hypothetical protein TRIADDRAFT_23582 [Trichoplax adhaerens]EDV26193.1 hypothetical protein TRIADDRAFT_23582 [Trichoplax adhaerens]|eukprot:XP_002112226.1 hypothetical protein TRIADDRAFT_23582 [Trichoplax adhaerens]